MVIKSLGMLLKQSFFTNRFCYLLYLSFSAAALQQLQQQQYYYMQWKRFRLLTVVMVVCFSGYIHVYFRLCDSESRLVCSVFSASPVYQQLLRGPLPQHLVQCLPRRHSVPPSHVRTATGHTSSAGSFNAGNCSASLTCGVCLLSGQHQRVWSSGY